MKYHRRQYIHLLLQVILFTANCLAENLTLSINFKRRIFVTDGAFLSLTVDPATLVNTTSTLIENIEKFSNMMQGLTPAYIRFGGPVSNSYIDDSVDIDPDDILFETHLTVIHRWAADVGLDVIACISPRYIADKSETYSWNPTNLAQLLSFNDHMGHNANWQLGYECQTRCDLSGSDLGRHVATLHETLETYPRYSDSLITGPDIVAYRTAQQQQYLRDYLSTAGDALSAITWHPDFADITVHGNDISVHSDNIAAEKDELYKVIGDIAVDKPLWIAESKPDEYKHRYLGALTWTRRLGNAAKLGVQVVMRQFLEFSRPTPDYWVSFLHKALVGREVLEVEIQSDNESHVYFYSQCTKPSALYEKGAFTIFGVNLTPRDVIASLKNFKIKTVHEYILSPDFVAGNKIFAEKVLLNGEPLDLIDNMKLPDLSPEIVTDSNGLQLNLASGNIGFWVIPNAKVRACTNDEEKTTEDIAAKKMLKRHVIRQVDEEEKQEEDINPLNLKNQKFHAKQEREKQRNNRTEIRRKTLKSKLYRRIKRLLQKSLQQKKSNETSNLERPSTIVFLEAKNNTSEKTEEQQNIDDRQLDEKTEKSDNKTEINNYIQDMLKKYNYVRLNRKSRAETKHSFKREVHDINNAMTLISKIEALLQLEKEIMSNDMENEIRNAEDILIETNGEFNEKFDELVKKSKVHTVEKVEKYFNDLLEDDKLTTKSAASDTIPVQENSTNNKRYTRDLNNRLDNPTKKMKHSRISNLKNRIKQKMRRKNDDKKEILSIASDLKNLDNRKSNLRNLFRQSLLKRLLQDNSYRDDPEHSAFNIQEHERTTRDVDRMLTELSARRNTILRKRSRIDDVRDHVNQRKSKRKDDFKQERLLSPLNPRITDSGESGFNGFLRRDPIRGFPEGDVFVTTGVSAERSGLDYDYVEDDEDDSRRKDQQEERESTTESAEDVSWIEVDDDQRDYTPNEFYENVNLPSKRLPILKNLKDYDDLSEAVFVLGKRENNKDNDGSTATNHLQLLDEEEVKKVKERSTRQLVNYHGDLEEKKYNRDADYETSAFHSELSTTPRRLTDIPTTKYDLTDYQTSKASPEDAKQKVEARSRFPSFFYQPALISPVKDNYNNFQALNMRPDVKYMENSNNRVFCHRRDKRSDWKKQLGLLAEEMIKEDAGNSKNCHCRVIQTRNSLKKSYNNRKKRDQTSVIEFASEAVETNANADSDLTRAARDVPNPMTKEEFDRIMTGEILPSTSVIETDSDYDKRDTIITRSNKSHRRANEAIQTMDVTSASAMSASRTSDISAERVMEEQTFFRTQPSTTSSEIKEATYDPAEVALEISSRSKENRQELSASNTESARPVETYLREETQDLKEETQRETINAVIEGGKAKERRCNDHKVSSKPDEETTKRIAQEYITTGTSKRAARKTTDYSRSNKSETRKESEEWQSENESSSNDKCKNRAKKKNNLKAIPSAIQNIPKSQLKDLARYEEYLVRRSVQIQKLREKLKERQEKRRNDTERITDDQTRNLKRRETWERFCENNDFCRLIDQERLYKFLVNEIEARVGDKNNENNNNDEENEEDRYHPIEFVAERNNNFRDQIYPRANVKHYPECNSHHYFLQHPKVVEIEQEPVILPASSGRKIFAIDPSTYRGGEPVLELHKEYLDTAPKYSSKVKFQTEAPKWTLKDFYRTPLKPANRDQQTFKLYDNYCGQEYAKKSQMKDAYEGENAVVLYLLDKHRQYDLPKKLAEFSQIYLSVLDQRDINQVAKDKTMSDSNNDDAESALEMTRKIGLPKKIDEEYTGSNKCIQHEELGNYYGENVGKKIDRSHKINDEIDDYIDAGVSNVKARNVEEGIINDDDSQTNGLLSSNTTPRGRRNAVEEQMAESRERTRQSRADARTEWDHDRYICMKEKDSGGESSEQSIPLYQLTRLSSDAILVREPKNYATISNKNFDQYGEKQSSKYAVLMPDKIKDVRPYEMLGAMNPERFSKRFKVSNWLDRYLPRRITNAMIRYLNDVSSEELEYENPLDTLSGSVEVTSDEEVSYSDYSDESSENRRKTIRNVADEVNCELREENQQHGVKSKESHEHLKMKIRMGSEERQAFMRLPEENEKTKRQRRHVEIDKQKTNKFILAEDAIENENDEYYLQWNNINENATASIDYPHSQKDEKVHDDLLEDFAKSRNVITSTENEGNNESLENSIAKSDKKSQSFMEETIPKLQGVIMDDLEKAKDLTESIEQFVDNFEENFNETSATDEETSSTNKTSKSTSNPLHLAIMNIKKFFTLFTGIC